MRGWRPADSGPSARSDTPVRDATKNDTPVSAPTTASSRRRPSSSRWCRSSRATDRRAAVRPDPQDRDQRLVAAAGPHVRGHALDEGAEVVWRVDQEQLVRRRGEDIAQLRLELLHPGPGASEPGADQVAGELGVEAVGLADHRHRDAEELRRQTRPGSSLAECPQEAGLADPGLTRDPDDAIGGQAVVEPRELGLPPEEPDLGIIGVRRPATRPPRREAGPRSL